MSVIATLTPAGEQLLAKIVAAYAALRITRVAVGDGIPATSDPTGLTHFVRDIPVSGVTYAGSNATILAQVISGDEELTITELGVYAQDPDDGEVLIAYMGLDAPEIVRPNADGIYHAKEFSIALLIGRVNGVLANIGSSTFVTHAQLDELARELAAKAFKPYLQSVVFPASGWTAVNEQAQQTVPVAGFTSQVLTIGRLIVPQDADAAAAAWDALGLIACFETTSGGVTAYCSGEAPAVDLEIELIVLG